MFDRLFGPRIQVSVTILGVVGGRMVQWRGKLRLRQGATVGAGLRAAGRAAGVDLVAALAEGAEPTLLANGERLDLPADLNRVLESGDLAWLMSLAGG